jgi:hypothetical protein
MLNQPLIDALTQHLKAGYDEAHLREETLKAGYDEATFAEALALARRNVAATASAPLPPVTETESVAPTTTAAHGATSATAPPEGVGLIGIGALISQTLRVATRTVAASVLFVVIMIGLILLIGGMAFAGLPMLLSTGNLAVGVIMLVVLYLASFVLGTCVGAAYLRTIVKRAEGVRFFAALGWSLRHFWTLFTTAFFFQFGTTGLGLCLGLVVALPLLLVGLEMVSLVAIYVVFAALMGYFGFTYTLLVDDNATGVKAMVGSVQLVYGRWWAVFGRLVVIGLGTLLFGLLAALLLGFLSLIIQSVASSFGVGLVFGLLMAVVLLAAFHILASGIVVLYESCVAVPSPKPLSEQWAGRLRIALIVMIVLGVLVMVAQLVLSVTAVLTAAQFMGGMGGGMPGAIGPTPDMILPAIDF